MLSSIKYSIKSSPIFSEHAGWIVEIYLSKDFALIFINKAGVSMMKGKIDQTLQVEK